ncbi:MAG: hypothetical protein GJT30_17500 [Geobacter sp.]|nr:hypothetical protein [Geobacter sp.]
MTLTSNETAWAVMIVTLAISLGWATLLAWITIKAQHAKSIDEIKDDTKKIFVRLFLWFSNICAVSALLLEFRSDEVINRRDVFLIVWSFAILFMSLIVGIINRMREMLELHKQQADATRQLTGLVGHTLDALPNNSKQTKKKNRA